MISLGTFEGNLKISAFCIPFRIFNLKHLKAEKVGKCFLYFEKHARFPINGLLSFNFNKKI